MKILYYAHSLGVYHTRREQEELDMIHAAFPWAVVYNPNRPDVQRHRDPMGRCLEMLHDRDMSGLVFSQDAGRITSGVLLEVNTVRRMGKPIWYIQRNDVKELTGSLKHRTSHGKKYWTV